MKDKNNNAIYFVFKNNELKIVSMEVWENSWIEWWSSIQ